MLTDDARVAALREMVAPADAVFLDAKIEAELQELDDESAAELLESIGQTERGLDALARAGFHTLRLQTYLTAGPKESRAWTIHQGDTAPKAAGVIHTDFEKGFIKAEIVSYDDLIEAGSMAAAKAAGKVRMEGKDYVMADGDVVEFRFQHLRPGSSKGRNARCHLPESAASKADPGTLNYDRVDVTLRRFATLLASAGRQVRAVMDSSKRYPDGAQAYSMTDGSLVLTPAVHRYRSELRASRRRSGVRYAAAPVHARR